MKEFTIERKDGTIYSNWAYLATTVLGEYERMYKGLESAAHMYYTDTNGTKIYLF